MIWVDRLLSGVAGRYRPPSILTHSKEAACGIWLLATSLPPGSPLKVLIVDDNRAVLATTVLYLQSQKFDAIGVESAEEALANCEHHAFDVVVTDLSMPGKDGIELASELRKNRQQARLILVTGGELSPACETEVRKGFDAILHKPFRLAELVKVMTATAQ